MCGLEKRRVAFSKLLPHITKTKETTTKEKHNAAHRVRHLRRPPQVQIKSFVYSSRSSITDSEPSGTVMLNVALPSGLSTSVRAATKVSILIKHQHALEI